MDINEHFESDKFKTALANGDVVLSSKETTREQGDTQFKEQVEISNRIYEKSKGDLLAKLEDYPSSTHDEKFNSLMTLVFEDIGELNDIDTKYSTALHKKHMFHHGMSVAHLDFLIQEVFYLNSCLKPMYAKLNQLVNKINRKRDEPLEPNIIKHDASNIEYFKDLVDKTATDKGVLFNKIKIASVMFFETLDKLYCLELDKVTLSLEKDELYNAKPSMQIYTLVDCFASLQPNKHYMSKKLEILEVELESHANFVNKGLAMSLEYIKANQ